MTVWYRNTIHAAGERIVTGWWRPIRITESLVVTSHPSIPEGVIYTTVLPPDMRGNQTERTYIDPDVVREKLGRSRSWWARLTRTDRWPLRADETVTVTTEYTESEVDPNDYDTDPNA
jgi:hypothetical protein